MDDLNEEDLALDDLMELEEKQSNHENSRKNSAIKKGNSLNIENQSILS